MEAMCSSETPVKFQRTTRRYIPEDGTLLHIVHCIITLLNLQKFLIMCENILNSAEHTASISYNLEAVCTSETSVHIYQPEEDSEIHNIEPEFYFVGFEVLTAVVMKSSVFWDETLCSPLKANRRFGGRYRLHLHG
jgi:hypothetical protein